MKLVDVDKLIEVINKHRNFYSGAMLRSDKALRDELEQIVRDIIEAPEVEAMTIEWLKQKYRENDPDSGNEDFDRYLWDSVCYVLTAWYEDQEEEDPIAWKDELEEE